MEQADLIVASNGRVLIPADMRAALGLRGGGRVVARIVDDTLVLQPLNAAIRAAQAMVARHVPAGARLADELIAERRAAAERE